MGNTASTKRLSEIDIVKGIGILLVLMGHRSLPGPIVTFIYSFHMPLFFFVSGYLYNSEKQKCFKDFMLRKISSILVPYICFWIISLVVQFIASCYGILPKVEWSSLPGQLIYTSAKGTWNGPLWFLICLFIVDIMYYFMAKYIKKVGCIVVIVLCGIVGWLLSVYEINLIFKLDIVFTGIVFYGIGNIIRKNPINIKLDKRIQLAACLLFTAFGSIFINETLVQMIVAKYGRIYPLFVLIALSGIYAIYIIAKLIKKNKVLEWMGQNSLLIMAVHYIIYMVIIDPIQYDILKIPTGNFFIRNSMTVVDVIICLLMIWGIAAFVNKYIPFLVGKKKVKA